jgi:hypothetical protein
MRSDARRIDAELRHRSARIDPERVVADLRDHARALSQPGRRNGDVGRAAPEHLAERAHVGKLDADLLGIEVDADASHREDVWGAHFGRYSGR